MKKINIKQFKGGPGNLFLVALFLVLTILAVLKLADFSHKTESINYSAFLKKLSQNQVQGVEITGSDLRGVYRDGRTRFETTIPLNAITQDKVYELLKDHNIDTNVATTSGDSLLWQLVYLLPFLLTMLGIWYFFRQSRSSGGNGGNIFSMSKRLLLGR